MNAQITVHELLLSEIVTSPFNPRKTFDEEKIIELAESIKTKKVLQPVLVRVVKGKYELVVGERRCRASLKVQEGDETRNTIPAIIRELSDQEVQEIQLIENFQREDVHPMEEADAIRKAIKSGNYSYEDIAVKVGKKLAYIRQRVKFNDLIPSFKKLFFRNGISFSDAFKACAMPAALQKEIFAEAIGEDDGKSRYVLNKIDSYKGNLSTATFNLDDTTLDKKAGACTGCKFNSAVNMLFPELAATPRCTNITCYKKKIDLHFNNELTKAKENPSIVLVMDSYSESEIIRQLKKEGHPILREGYSFDYRKVKTPVTKSLEEFTHDFLYDEDPADYTQEEIEKEYKKYLKDIGDELLDYSKKTISSKYKLAFMVYDQYGSDTGKYIYIEMNEKPANKEARNAIKNGTPGVEDIDAEILRIKEREKRGKELDGEKIWRQVNDLRVDKALAHDGPLSSVELTALVVALYEKIGYSSRKKIEILLGKTAALSMAKSDVPNDIVNKVCRFFMCDVLSSVMGSHLTGGNQFALKAVIESYLPEKVRVIEEEQAAKAAKRKVNVDKRIGDLQKVKKELQKQENQPSKKTSKKKKV